jgi:protein gp37
VWIGATIVSQAEADRDLAKLRAIRARVRFLSLEPLLGAMPRLELAGVHWVIVGGESGPGARPMRVEWVRGIRDQCIGAGVAFFLKQWGVARNNPLYQASPSGVASSTWVSQRDPAGKGGSTLDGVRWAEYPKAFGGV